MQAKCPECNEWNDDFVKTKLDGIKVVICVTCADWVVDEERAKGALIHRDEMNISEITGYRFRF